MEESIKASGKYVQEAIKNISTLEKEIVNQDNINNEYRSKLSSLKIDYDSMVSHLRGSQQKIDLKLSRIDDRLVEVAKQQRELFCLMMLCKNTTLDHYEILDKVNAIEDRQLREIIEVRFFPNTKKEINEKKTASNKLNEQLTDININSVLHALERIQEKFLSL